MSHFNLHIYQLEFITAQFCMTASKIINKIDRWKTRIENWNLMWISQSYKPEGNCNSFHTGGSRDRFLISRYPISWEENNSKVDISRTNCQLPSTHSWIFVWVSVNVSIIYLTVSIYGCKIRIMIFFRNGSTLKDGGIYLNYKSEITCRTYA